MSKVFQVGKTVGTTVGYLWHDGKNFRSVGSGGKDTIVHPSTMYDTPEQAMAAMKRRADRLAAAIASAKAPGGIMSQYPNSSFLKWRTTELRELKKLSLVKITLTQKIEKV